MERIGQYKQITEFTNENAGTSEWCIAKKDKREYFVKKFQRPVYPSSALQLPPEKYQNRVNFFHAEELRYKRLYDALNAQNASGAMIVPEAVITYQFHICTIAEYFKGNIKPEEVHKLSPWQRLVLMRTLTLALMNVHKAKIVHGDMKPDNTIIYQNPETGMCRLRLIDFDGGYFTSDPPNESEDIKGDMAYWAPEIYARFDHSTITLDEKIDDFALGLILHLLWCGSLPDKPKDQTVGQFVYEGNLPGIDESGMPLAIAKTIQGLLVADPQKRMPCEQVYYILGVQMAQYPQDVVNLAGGADPGSREEADSPKPHAASSVKVLCVDALGRTIREEEYVYTGADCLTISAKEIEGYSVDGCDRVIVHFDEHGHPDKSLVTFSYEKSGGFWLAFGIAAMIAIIVFTILVIASTVT